jgi:chaperonin GroES
METPDVTADAPAPEGWTLVPLLDWVLIERDPPGDMTPGGIAVVGRGKPLTGTVVAVGPGRVVEGSFVPTTVRQDDRVLFDRYYGDEIKFNSRQLLMGREPDLLATVDDGTVIY